MARRGRVGRGGSVSGDEAGEDETAARTLRTAGLAVTPPRHAVYRVLHTFVATRGVDFEPTVERSDVYGRCGSCRHHAK
jgi:hypothetical protein